MCNRNLEIIIPGSFRNYFEVDRFRVKLIWYPKFDFGNLMKYDQSKIYGGTKSSTNMYFNGNQSFYYVEKFLITIGCPFEFNLFPHKNVT